MLVMLMEFYKQDRVEIIRHCDVVFTLEIDGIQDMGPTTFEEICRYVWFEYPPKGFEKWQTIG